VELLAISFDDGNESNTTAITDICFVGTSASSRQMQTDGVSRCSFCYKYTNVTGIEVIRQISVIIYFERHYYLIIEVYTAGKLCIINGRIVLNFFCQFFRLGGCQ